MSQTVARALTLLQTLGERPASLSEVAQSLEVHKSTALRLLQDLEHEGFARKQQDGRYTVGAGLIRLANSALDSLDLRDVARPYLARLNRTCGHTIHLATYADGDVVYIDKLEGHTSVRMHSRIGDSATLHTAGVAKAVLANLEPLSLRESVISRLTFPRHTDRTITSERRYREELDRVRADGFAQDDGEYEDFIVCVAAPVRSADPYAMAAISISAPRVIRSLPELRELVPELKRTAADIARELGGEPR